MESTQIAPVDVFASTIQMLLSLGIWIISSLSGHVIGKKLQHPAAWLAWVPVLNLFYYMSLSGRSALATLLLFVPILNIFVFGKMFGDIAERLSMPTWLGWAMLLPVANFFIMVYLAASGVAIRTARPHQPTAFERAHARTS